MRRGLVGLAGNLALQQGLSSLSARSGRVWHRPSKVSFEVSLVCNLHCVQCGFWRRRRRPDALSEAEWLETLRALRRWAGPFALTLGSGEPFLEPATLPILREASALGVITVCVSHGGLIDAALADEICAAGLGTLHLSLDGSRPETHDAQRGAEGAHAGVLRAVRLLKSRKDAPVLKINTIVTGRNLDELEPLLRWASGEGLAGVNFQALGDFGERWRDLWPSDLGAVHRAIDRLTALKRSGAPVLNSEAQLERMKIYFADPAAEHPDLLCGTFTQFSVLNDGTVKTCGYKNAVGHVRAQRVEKIWASARTRERQREIVGCKKPCVLFNCNFRPSLGARAAEFLRHRG